MTLSRQDCVNVVWITVAQWCGRVFAVASVVILVASCSTATPPNIPLKWEYVREKQRRVPDVLEYVTTAENHLTAGNYWRARWYFRKAYKVSRSLTNRGLCQLGIALAYFGSADFMLAAETLDKAIRDYGNYIPFEQALLFEYSIARDRFHRKLDVLWSSLDDNALEVYRNLQAQAPYHPVAEVALYSAGELEMERGNYDPAVGLFTKFLNRYSKSKRDIDVRLNLVECLLILAKNCEGDPLLESRARREIKKIDEKSSTDAQKVRRSDLEVLADFVKANQLIFLGSFYQRVEHWNPKGSRRYLSEFMIRFPTSPRMPEAKQLLDKLPAEPIAPKPVEIGPKPMPKTETPRKGGPDETP